MTDLAAELEPHIPALRRYAWALLRDQEAADDLVQDCLERAIGRWHLRRRDASTLAWLLTIQRNLFLNGLRRRVRIGQHVALAEADGHAGSDSGGERRLLARDALAALDDLTEDQRSLLLLIGVEDLSYAEAARVFGVPEGTIMSRLSRARAQLRRLVDGAERVALRRVK
jgi:RNA polymerase sigma-70 factor (ECF subfamily)